MNSLLSNIELQRFLWETDVQPLSIFYDIMEPEKNAWNL
jgi:hypothetical protein